MSHEVSGAQSQTTASAAEPAGAVVGAVIAKRVPWSSFSAQLAWLGGPVSLAALALMVAAALASGTSAGGPMIMIERLSGGPSTLLAQIDSALPTDRGVRLPRHLGVDEADHARGGDAGALALFEGSVAARFIGAC